MILLVHMIFGAAVGYKAYSLTNSIFIAGLFALLGHYFLDLFPHVEYLKSTEESVKKIKSKSPKEYLPDALKVFTDLSLGFILIFILKDQSIIYFYAILGIIPDGFTVVNSLIYNNTLKKHQYFHGEIIHFLKHKKISLFWRILTQTIATLISIYILIY